MTKEGQEFLHTEINTLQHFTQLLNDYIEQILREHLGIGYRDFQFLTILDQSEPCVQQDIAKSLHLTKSSVSKRIDSLLKKEFIQRKTNPKNRRQNIIRMTGRGVMVVIKAYRLLTETVDPFFAVLGDNRPMFNTYIEDIEQQITGLYPGQDSKQKRQ